MRKLTNAFTFSGIKRTIAIALTSCMTLQSLQAAPSVEPPAFSIALPGTLGFISDVYSAGRVTSDKPNLILIQNLHVNRSVQFAISGILRQLKKQNLLPAQITVEGATGPMDVAEMQAYPDANIRKAASDYLVEQGEMPGAMHFVVTEGKGSLYGVETDEVFKANLETYQRTYEQRLRLKQELDKLSKALPRLRRNQSLRDKADLLSNDIEAVSHLVNAQTTPNELNSTLGKVSGVDRSIKAGPAARYRRFLD